MWVSMLPFLAQDFCMAGGAGPAAKVGLWVSRKGEILEVRGGKWREGGEAKGLIGRNHLCRTVVFRMEEVVFVRTARDL